MDTKLTHPLTAFRTDRKWTLDRLAAELKVQRNTVWRWENGRMPRPKDWQKIEAVTGITGSQLAAFKAVATAPSQSVAA